MGRSRDFRTITFDADTFREFCQFSLRVSTKVRDAAESVIMWSHKIQGYKSPQAMFSQ